MSATTAQSIASRLNALLRCGDSKMLLSAMQSDWLNAVIPGLRELSGCDQGATKHLEGDVAEHTALVVQETLSVAKARLDREPTSVELLGALLHDLSKPQTRRVNGDGTVSFPEHERIAAERLSTIAPMLDLSPQEKAELTFVIAEHGRAHSWPMLAASERQHLKGSPWIVTLAILQEADAKSCLLPGGHHLPVFWQELVD
ncbi:MAG: HDIG domain-containing protein [Bdellovibrionota bacterium]